MKTLSDLLLYLLAAAFIQNFILTTGFGSSIMLRIVRRPKDILLFSGLLAGFSLLTVLIGYPCDMLMGTGQLAKLIRPVVMIAIAAVLYILTVVVLRRFLPAVFQRLSRLLALAAFNNVVIGIALISNHRFSSLPSAVGLSLGACLGFLVLAWLTAEGMERLDNPDMPQSFRGLPATLVYLGLLALALLGFFQNVPLL